MRCVYTTFVNVPAGNTYAQYVCSCVELCRDVQNRRVSVHCERWRTIAVLFRILEIASFRWKQIEHKVVQRFFKFLFWQVSTAIINQFELPIWYSPNDCNFHLAIHVRGAEAFSANWTLVSSLTMTCIRIDVDGIDVLVRMLDSIST